MTTRSLLRCTHIFALLLVALTAQVAAQVQVRAEAPRRHWVKGEAIQLKITITNHSGREMLLDNMSGKSWLDVRVSDEAGRTIHPVKRGLYRPASVLNGRSISKTINVSAQYNMHRTGKFGLKVGVRIPGQADYIYESNFAFIVIHEGSIVHRRQVGLPSDPSQLREFRVVQLNATGRVQTYAQVFDMKRKLAVRTTYLGETLNFQPPKAGLDSKTHYHILFQNTPVIYTHAEFNPEGQLVAHSRHKRVGAGVPSLISETNGTIVVLGGVPYDPTAEDEAELSIHKLSDRPQ